MTPLTAGLIGLVILLALLVIEMPIGFAITLVGFLGMSYLRGWEAGLGLLKTIPHSTAASYELAVIPLFILMGNIAFQSGMSEELYRAMNAFLGRLRGGLAMATIGGCAAFAAICGSSTATAVTMGTVALPEMEKYGYSKALATGTIAAGGTLGILIPPSIGLAIYGIITEQSIGKLFIAGLIPGILLAGLFMATIYTTVRINPNAGPQGTKTSAKEKLKSLSGVWPVVVLFLLVIGGLYAGIFSASEAAGIGAFGAFGIALVRRRLPFSKFSSSLWDSVRTTAMIMAILIGASIFGYFVTVTKLAFVLAEFMGQLHVSPFVVLAIVIAVYAVLGCVMEMLAIVLITVPIFYPVVVAVGFDGIWFGVIVTIMSEMGLITPQVGLNVFVIAGIAKHIPIQTIFRGALPFVVAMFVLIVLLTAFPQIALFLPSHM